MKPIPQPEAPKLNLVALMDIFTILVFFLMVNSSNVEVMEGDSNMKLPIAYSEESAGTTLKLTVVNDSIILQGRSIVDLRSLNLSEETIPSLQKELVYQAGKSGEMSAEEQVVGRPITLFADQSLPYEVLRLILATCASTDYRNVSLAVEGEPSSVAEGETPTTPSQEVESV